MAKTQSLDEAEIRFEKVVRLRTGERTEFSVSVQQPDLLPSASGTPAQGRVRLACIVEARLVAPSGGVSITPPEWLPDKYVPPEPTRWTWLVSADDAGEAGALLQLRPAILVGDGGDEAQKETLGIVDFTVTFEVVRSASDAAGIAWNWIAGSVGFVAALLGIPVAYRSWRGKQDRPEPPVETTDPVQERATDPAPPSVPRTAAGDTDIELTAQGDSDPAV